MPGMTMPFKVKDAALLEGKQPGDLVTATLVVGEVDAHLSTLTKTGTRRSSRRSRSGAGRADPDAGRRVADSSLRRSGRRRRADLVAARPPRRADVHLHALPAARLLPADGPALRGGAEDAAEHAGAGRRAARIGHASIPRSTRRPCSKTHAQALGADPRVWTSSPAHAEEVRHASRSRFGVHVERECRRRRSTSPTTCAPPSSIRTARVVKVHSGTRLDARRNSLPTSKRLPLPRTDPGAAAGAAAHRGRAPRRRAAAHAGAVQHWLNELPYNTEKGGETLRSFRGVVRTGTAHCLEAALAAAVILEQHRYPPLVLSFESIDLLDHVIFVYRGADGWGSVARSRDPGPARPQAGVRHAARAGAQLLRGVHRLHRPHQGVRGGRPARARRVRLAAVGEERLEGRAAAARLAAPPHRVVRRARGRACGGGTARSARRTATSRGSTTAAASAGRRCRRNSAIAVIAAGIRGRNTAAACHR